ncbi:unnamed protein product [Polarella glacialis]|uniref:Uncharacterized protein n=1 Tax=Polarella glacialis TaxID=89957 RepID=A0A813GI52_POLGL|nr:unnamed protein product [Polarella glacialis]
MPSLPTPCDAKLFIFAQGAKTMVSQQRQQQQPATQHTELWHLASSTAFFAMPSLPTLWDAKLFIFAQGAKTKVRQQQRQQQPPTTQRTELWHFASSTAFFALPSSPTPWDAKLFIFAQGAKTNARAWNNARAASPRMRAHATYAMVAMNGSLENLTIMNGFTGIWICATYASSNPRGGLMRSRIFACLALPRCFMSLGL